MIKAFIAILSLHDVVATGSGGGFFGLFSSAVTQSSHKSDDKSASRGGEDNGNKSSTSTNSKGRGSSWFSSIEFEEYDDDGSKPSRRLDDYDGGDNNQSGESSVLDALQLHPLLQIPLSFSLNGVLDSPVTPVCTFCDTAAMRTVMSWDTAKRLGLLPHLDRRYAGGKAIGVGSCRVMGRIPAGLCDLHLCGTVTVPSPPITILDTTGTADVELLLGLDFLREYRAILDLREEELRILVDQEEHCIPFLRPRGSATVTGLSGGGNGSFWKTKWGTKARHGVLSSYSGDYEDDDFEDEHIDMSGV
ncbi:hypothetical protein ACA910_003854 [Epithemia clementina (nom. ined.)]